MTPGRRTALGRMLFALPALAVLLALGCGEPTSSVSGKVYYDTTLIPVGIVTFAHENGTAKTSQIKEDGSYKIEGIPPGKVTICVDTSSAKPAPVPPRSGAGKVPTDSTYKPIYGQAQGKWVPIPDIYINPRSSTLKYEVKPGDQNHDIKIPKG
jgi:hypothetical protein